MKKIVLFLLIAVVAAGAVWGQVAQVPAPTTIGVIDSLGFWDFFVVPLVSTESRYSAGIFSAYADDFMWFTGYDPKVGTFLVLGGYPQVDGGPVETTDTQSSMAAPTKLSLGFAKSFKSGYLGVYFGGHLVEASGTNNGLKGKDHIMDSQSTWENNFAILYGSEKIGAVRFDIAYEGTQYNEHDVDGKPTGPNAQSVTSAPKIGLGFGKVLAKDTEFYVQLGYEFPDLTVETDPEDSGKKDTKWGSSTLALQAGINKPMASSDNTDSSLSVDFIISGAFGANGKGDYNLKDNEYVKGGSFGVGADLGIKQVIKADEKLSIGFKPNVALGFIVSDENSYIKGSKEEYDAAKKAYFEMAAGVNLGVKYQINQKFGLYTGVGFDLISWKTASYSEGKDEKYDETEQPNLKASAWKVEGISPRYETLHGATLDRLGFGLTFAPTKNIVIGAGINSFLDNIFYFDVGSMQLGTGLSNPGDGSELGWIGNNLIGNLSFDLTISAKF